MNFNLAHLIRIPKEVILSFKALELLYTYESKKYIQPFVLSFILDISCASGGFNNL